MRRLLMPLLAALPLALTGCSLFGGGDEDARQTRIEELQLPPDLTAEERQRALTIPEGEGERTVTASGDGGGPVVPQPRRVSVQRVGGERWLTVDAPPRQTWQWVADFLDDQGVAIARRRAELGVIESEWLYTDKPLSGGAFAPSLPGPENATVADRYLFRVEPGSATDSTDIFLAQRRVARDDEDRWRLLPSDPFLEAEALRSLLVYLGAEAESSFERVASAGSGSSASNVTLSRGDDDKRLRLIVPNGFFDAWRRVGLALDRAGFTVAERNRGERYVDIRYDLRASQGPEEEGFFEALAFWRASEVPDTVKTFRLGFSENDDGASTRLGLTRTDGESVSPELNEEILGLLAEKIR